jgi:inward rectifier potassium channel
MRSRWFHRPVFHTGITGIEKRTGWLELFFDLVFVAALIQLGNGLTRGFSFEHVAVFALVFSVLWITWTGFSSYSNRYTVDDFVHRMLVFAQMLAVTGMAIFAPRVLIDQPMLFSLCFAAAQFLIACMYARSLMQTPEGRASSLFWGCIFFLGAVLWLISAFLPEPINYVLWGLTIAAYTWAPFSKQSSLLARNSPPDLDHLAERYGLLTLIVLGEAFVKVMSVFANASGEFELFLQAIFTLVIVFTLWWIYFDDVAESKIKPGRFTFSFWLYGHLPLHAGMVAVGLSIPFATQLQRDAPGADQYRCFMCGALGLAFLATGLIDGVTQRRQALLRDGLRVNVRLASAAILLALAPASRFLDTTLLVFIISLVCCAQVVFDMLMAPFEPVSNQVKMKDLAEAAREARLVSQPGVRQRRTSGAIRRGTPSELRTDFYSFLVQTSWRSFLAAVIALYLLANVLFAAIYMSVPGSIHGARANSFADAFYFSIQTMATIGYGVLYPETDFANSVVVIEAVVGLAATALITGMIVAKASRPHAGVLFSKTAVITRRDGKSTLLFRVGNTKGTEISSAEVVVSILRDEVSSEGERLRRIYDLKLVRHRSAFFSLTWTVMHEIDEASPLYKFANSGDDPSFMSLICVLTGHESTFGQTVYSRHSYFPEDIFIGKKFVDVLSALPDGRLIVDYTLFHDLQA